MSDNWWLQPAVYNAVGSGEFRFPDPALFDEAPIELDQPLVFPSGFHLIDGRGNVIEHQGTALDIDNSRGAIHVCNVRLRCIGDQDTKRADIVMDRHAE